MLDQFYWRRISSLAAGSTAYLAQTNWLLGEVGRAREFIEEAVARAVADEAQLNVVLSIDPEKVPNAIATRTPITFAKNHRLLAYAEDDEFVHVYCADPFDTAPLDDLRLLFGKPVECVVAPAEKIVDAINRVFEREAGGGELETEAGEVHEEEGGGDILDSDDEAPVIRWVTGGSFFRGCRPTLTGMGCNSLGLPGPNDACSRRMGRRQAPSSASTNCGSGFQS